MGLVSLSVREQLFVAALVKGASQTDAAIAAGYAPKHAASIASRLSRKVKVAAAIEKAKDRVLGRAEVSKADVLRDLDRRGDKAEGLEQLSAAIRASELQGKEMGMFAERHVLAIEEDRRRLLAAVEPEGPDVYQRVLARLASGTVKALPGGE